MTAEVQQITVDGVVVQVVRKPIRTLRLGVYPPQGRVRLAVPWALSDAAVRAAVADKLDWIRRHQLRFEAQARQAPRELVSGECLYYLGRRYRLQVVPGTGARRMHLADPTTLELHGPPDMDLAARGRVVEEWYRQGLRALLPPLLAKWEAALGVRAAEWHIRRMKTRWGSCNPSARRLWFNLELAKKPEPCLEYVVAHELTHLLERRHNGRFRAILDRQLPPWRLLRRELNAGPQR